MHTSIKTLRVPALLELLFVSAAAFTPLPTTTAVSGTFTLTYVKPSEAKGKDAKGADIFVSTATGSNRNTGAAAYLSAARVTNVDTAAMVQGNGTHRGHATFREGSNTIVKRFAGALTTKMVNGKPESTFQGKWTVESGTGKYSKASGSGTYKGRFETGTRYTVEWKGNVSM